MKIMMTGHVSAAEPAKDALPMDREVAFTRLSWGSPGAGGDTRIRMSVINWLLIEKEKLGCQESKSTVKQDNIFDLL